MPPSSSSSTQSELRWYYAVDDAHVGPVSATKFWQLADDGVIKADTLVWCTGYTDWVPAQTVDGLFRSKKNRGSDPGFVSNSPQHLAPTPMRAPPPEENSDVDTGFLLQIAKSGIMFGLVCIVFTRGCDRIDKARLEGLAGELAISQQEFNEREKSKLLPLQQRLEELRSIDYVSAEEKKQLQEATESLRTEKNVLSQERARLEAETWGPLRSNEARVSAEYQSIQMFRRIAGLIGTTLTLIGLGIALFYAPAEQQLGVWIVLGVVIAAAYLS
ncbi:DUF4339 domain-containing protein [Blastopirellula marina]|nr:DUF4339 domain-containing protein [Blastopirellula marina]